MLSPASLRVCCLAVMAPALTKADRQADCLPVVLSESFCIPKTPDTYNITARISENRFKCACPADYSHNKKKHLMHRACWRTHKSNSGIFCKYRTVGNDSPKSLLYINRVRTQTKLKTWQSTKATTAYAGKIKLKYTMNKNTSNIRNMGLAKANTSLGLQSLKKFKRFSKENQSSGPINVMDDSLNFSDSADSPMQIDPIIADNRNSDSDVLLRENVSVPCVSSNGRTSNDGVLNFESEPVLENKTEPHLSAGADESEVMDTTDKSVTLTGLLESNTQNIETKVSSNAVSTLPCSDPGTCTSDVSVVNTEFTGTQESSLISKPQSDSTFKCSESDIPAEKDAIPIQSLTSKQASNSIFTKFTNLKIPFLDGKYCNNPLKATSLFETYNGSILQANALRLLQVCDKIKYPVITDSRFGSKNLIVVRQEKKPCCLPSSQELDVLKSMLVEKSPSVCSAVSSSRRLLGKHLSSHVKKQIGSLFEQYQRILQIPCQRPAKHAHTKLNKHPQAELFQSDEVKSMSTAELVKFVNNFQGSQTRLSPKAVLPGTAPDSTENIPINFDEEDCEDIKHTSGVLLGALKNVLKESDPYLTEESSEEECESESEDEDEEETVSESETAVYESAQWKYLMNRTKLGSRSTWLLARVHELEFRIKEYSDRWTELVKTEGSVCLKEPSDCVNSESEEISMQASVKKNTLKNFVLPLNGFLDCTDTSQMEINSNQSELGSLKNSSSSVDTERCRRALPLNTQSFRKRKIVLVPGLHTSCPKFTRLSTINCTCNSQDDLAPCILCTGQYHSVPSVDPDSMALRDRIAILDSHFHPALSSEKDIPYCLHLENVLKTDPKYHNVRAPSPEPNTENDVQPNIKPKYSDLRSHRKLSRYARSLSAKYRNKHHRTNKHLRKHKFGFGKWRKYQSKHSFRARNRFRRHSIVSSGSSPDSPVNSPLSIYDDGYEKRRRDESQFDIDDVIIPCNSRSGRLVEIQYKEIMIPSWRSIENDLETDNQADESEEAENLADSYLTKRHDLLEVEEKEKVKRSALNLNKRMRRNRCDSRADSSGANTPDPTSLYNNQDNVFQIPNFCASAGPASPASRPATPNSAVISDDSQPPFGSSCTARPEKKKVIPKRTTEENNSNRGVVDYDEVSPFEPLQFPLTDEVYEQLLLVSDHNKEVDDMPSNTSSFPASPISSSSSTSTVEDEDEENDEEDITDPEWTVVKPMRTGTEQALVLKFAKR